MASEEKVVKKKKLKFKLFSKKKKKKDNDIEVLDMEEGNTSKKKKNKKKKKFVFAYSKPEFVFNFISLVFVICVGLYYGGRSFYFYSLQHKAAKESAQTVNGLILNNNEIQKDEKSDGLHRDDKGYFFKGKVKTNYVWFANRMFRVMRVNSDNTVKLISEDLVSSFMWGENTTYDDSNLRLWLSPVDEIQVSGVYYKTIPASEKFVLPTYYTIDKLEENKVNRGDKEFGDKVVSVTLNDYIAAGGKSGYLNNGKLYFLLGYNEDDSNIYVEEDGSIAECSNLDGYGIRAVITFDKNIPVLQGKGTAKDPYVVDQGKDVNYVDSYVKLGDDIWKVFDDNDGKIKMYLNGYIKDGEGNEIYRQYSGFNNRYDYFDDANLGFYLANDYRNSLSYKDLIVDNVYPYGEMSAETGYRYPNVYNETYTGNMAMLNIFDYVSNNDLNDFFRDNTGSDLATTQYSVLSNGALDEIDVTDQKHIVPVISISTSSIKSGTGKLDDPYIAG